MPPPQEATSETETEDFGNAAGQGAPEPTPEVINPPGNECQPGHYVGRMGGMYRTAAWGNGTVPVAFGTSDVAGRPGLEFWLERVDSDCTAEEFCPDFAIKGGKLRGWGNPTADPNGEEPAVIEGWGARFEMDLSGELDCSAGEFRGTLTNACYDVAGTLFRMEGTLQADYNKPDNGFESGQWELDELPLPGVLIQPDPNIGGEGNWQASHQDDGSSPIEEGDGLCDKMTGFETAL